MMQSLRHFPFALALLACTASLHAALPPKQTPPLASPDQVPEGLAKSDWQSIRAAYEAGRHAFQPIEGGWQARNPGQQWTTKFDGRGFVAEPRGGGWQWGLELKSYGFAGQERAVGGVPGVKAAGARLSYQWDAAVQEWWVNDARGLEHGFTVLERPVGAPSLDAQLSIVPTQTLRGLLADSNLNFLLAVRGTLTPVIAANAHGVEFRDAAGATVLTYSGLKVWDADGKTLPSHFAAAEAGVRLLVDERGARYPLTIDPIAQQAYLKASNTGGADYFGYSVAVSGDTVVVGAHDEDSSTTGVNGTPNESASASGAAYVFTRSGTTWTQQAFLKAGNTGLGDVFGYSVAVAGDTAVVGAYLEDSSTTGVNSTPNESSHNAGAAYVFTRSGTMWTQQAFLKASNTGESDYFGYSVAVSGDTVVVGAFREGSSTTGVNSTPNELASEAGAAYVFTRSGTTWMQQAYLKASNTGASDLFGRSVAVSGDTVVVGAFHEDSGTTGVNSAPNNSTNDTGAAYVFARSGTTWTQQAYLKASNTGASDLFGYSVAVAGDTVVIGAYQEDSSTTGVNSASNDNSSDSGAAYVFTRSGTTWTQQAYLKASNTEEEDYFGYSVAVSGDTVIVGAYGEDSSTTGVNSAPNNFSFASGAAYVFTRSGVMWTQQAYLKASNTGGSDYFGYSVSVSGDTVVVGAYQEDSSTTGVNSTPNELAANSGAAYIFSGIVPLPAPTVTAIAPTSGSTSGGTSVTITGTGYTGATAVTLGGVAATGFTVVNATTITATTPAHAAGLVNVVVTTTGGTGTGVGLYTYVNPYVNQAPTVMVDDWSGMLVSSSLLSFTGTGGVNPGASPYGSLVQGSDGSLYGMTQTGGTDNLGTVFKMAISGGVATRTTLVEFTGSGGANPGANPSGSLVQGSDGSFYGMTESGGTDNLGTVFQVVISGGVVTRTTLVDFGGANPGSYPAGSLVQGSDGSFYGMTAFGGTDDFGTVFKVTISGGVATLTTLVDFTGNVGANPGAYPQGSLVQGSDGNFYGMTYFGGTGEAGTVFKMAISGGVATRTTLVEFTGNDGANPGAYPAGSLVQGSDGSFYGMTREGGTNGLGTVFQVAISGGVATRTTLVDFDGANGWYPSGSLVEGRDGSFYGVTSSGGPNEGTIFKMMVSGGNAWLTQVDSGNYGGPYAGRNPQGSLVQGRDGRFYGMTSAGGTDFAGTIFAVAISVRGDEGSLVTQTGTFSDPDGDAVTLSASTGTVTHDGVSMWTWTATPADGPATLPVTITATDATGLTAEAGFFLVVDNLRPTVAISAPAAASEDVPVSFTFTAADVSAADQAAGFAWTLNYGDGTGDQTVAAGTASPLARTHVFANPGTFSATAVATDKDGSGSRVVTRVITIAVPTLAVDRGAATRTTLVDSAGANPGVYNGGSLVQGSDGIFYGMTPYGGTSGYGTIFKMAITGGVATQTTLVNFTGTSGANPGAYPQGSLVQGSDGSFYGMTSRGGTSDWGTVFEVAISGGVATRTTLVEFTGTAGANPGAHPQDSLVQGSDGSFYGMTSSGGTIGFGTVFKMAISGGFVTRTTLVDFTGFEGANPGLLPYGSLVQGSDGSFYGMTPSGGTSGRGTIFKMAISGGVATRTTLVNFTGTGGANPGAYPNGSLVQGSDGSFYGMTPSGGTSDEGTLFKMAISGGVATRTTLVDFTGIDGANPGARPEGSLVQGSDGGFYGMTEYGGTGDYGTVFKVAVLGNLAARTTLVDFTGNAGANPGAYPADSLVLGGDGSFYGITPYGGPGNYGTIFKLNIPPLLATGTEGSPATQTGTFSDPDGNATVTLAASTGTVTKNDAAGTWSWTAPRADGPSIPTVTITATDTASLTATTWFTFFVTNVPPTAAISAPATATVNTPVSFTFTAADASLADQAAGFAWTLDYGDGTGDQSVAAGSASPLARTHTFANPSTFSVTATATDKDSGVSAVATQTVTIYSQAQAWRVQYFGDPANSGLGADAGDFDFDGVPNLLEFATGSDPTGGNAIPGVLVINGGTLDFFYTRAKAAAADGVGYFVEFRADLFSGAWSTAGVIDVLVSEDANFAQRKASITPAPVGGGNAGGFMRLRVEALVIP